MIKEGKKRVMNHNVILSEDINEIATSKIINWEKMKDKTILITGATGLIGSLIVKVILRKNEIDDLNLNMILVSRSEKEVIEKFGNSKYIDYIITSVENFTKINKKVDYIIHAASPTKSKFFIENPVETLETSVIGTRNILEYAKISNASSMVYLSSMEMYGTMNEDNVTEDMLGYIDPLNVRSSYSEGKRISELYCYSYYKEYNVPVKIARIAQTFGAGISKNESRVYKIFADAIINKQDIILKSTGRTIINFSYTVDTVIGIFKIILDGENGEAYNLVSDKTDMTILDSAKWLAKTYGEGKVNVVIDIPKENAGFAPDNNMILSNKKIKKIGWSPRYTLKQGYDRLLKYLKEEKINEEKNNIN